MTWCFVNNYLAFGSHCFMFLLAIKLFPKQLWYRYIISGHINLSGRLPERMLKRVRDT